MFETTLLGAFWHERIDMTQLPPLQAVEDVDKGQSSYGRQRLDPRIRCTGIIGAGPRAIMTLPSVRHCCGKPMRWFNAEVAVKLIRNKLCG
ncbi:MAG: hypothetical protein R3E89_13960 [Thiolinea sp.]